MMRIAGALTALALAACSQEAPRVSQDPTGAPKDGPSTSLRAQPPRDVEATDVDAGDAEENPLLNRIWVRVTGAGDPPGAMLVFLDDGTLIQDSCWETYRLSEWRKAGDGTVGWSEDGMEITADVVAVDDEALALRLNLVGGAEEQRFKAAETPFVCPDMPR
jgi:hypothetical protein